MLFNNKCELEKKKRKRIKIEPNYYYRVKLYYWQLLLYGVHIGHSFKNSSLYSGWMVLTYKKNVLILNMYKTLLGIREGYRGFDYSAKYGLPIWFINLDKGAEIYIAYAARTCGELSFSKHWIHGLVTNFYGVSAHFKRLRRMTMNGWPANYKRLEINRETFKKTRWTYPRSAIISNVAESVMAAIECTRGGVPALGVSDTNAQSGFSNIATPGNDDSTDSLVFFNTHISLYVLRKKFGAVINWYTKKEKKLISFKEWMKKGLYEWPEIRVKIKENKKEEERKTVRKMEIDYETILRGDYVKQIKEYHKIIKRFRNNNYKDEKEKWLKVLNIKSTYKKGIEAMFNVSEETRNKYINLKYNEEKKENRKKKENIEPIKNIEDYLRNEIELQSLKQKFRKIINFNQWGNLMRGYGCFNRKMGEIKVKNSYFRINFLNGFYRRRNVIRDTIGKTNFLWNRYKKEKYYKTIYRTVFRKRFNWYTRRRPSHIFRRKGIWTGKLKNYLKYIKFFL